MCAKKESAHLFLSDNLGSVIQRHRLPFSPTLIGDLFEGDRLSLEQGLVMTRIESQGIFLQRVFEWDPMKKGQNTHRN